MTKEIYEAMRQRITVIYDYEDDYDFPVPDGADVFKFSNEGLNEGLSKYDIRYIDSVVWAIKKTKGRYINWWNICEQFYAHVSFNVPDFDGRLLQTYKK